MITESAEETRRLGRRLGDWVRGGEVLLLRGPLGAGKSELVRGLAEGLGVTERVTSPSFTILNVYENGRLPLYHFDWYRINDPEELYEIGAQDYLRGPGVAAVEWPEQAEEVAPETCLEIVLRPLDEERREIRMIPRGGFGPLPPELETGET